MYPAPFDYYRPSQVPEAIALLEQHPEAKLLAGGHSLLPMMKLRLASPSALIDLHGIPGLAGVQRAGDSVVIGPLTTYDALLADPTIQQTLPLMLEAATVVGDLQVRNRGTIGGSAAHADPAADFPAVLLALEAQFRVVGPQGERTIAATDFFQDLFTTALAPNEVLTEIRMPVPAPGTGMAYEKFAHPASGYAIVGVAAVVGPGGQPLRVAITGAGPVARRASATEQALSGQPLSEQAIARAAEQAGQGMTFLGDIHAGEDYRRHLTQVYTRRALTRAWQQAQG